MEPTTPSRETRAAEREQAEVRAKADRPPTDDEEAAADEHEMDPEAAAHAEEMYERGAHQEGEGRLP
jgi:hypothetical protein